VGGTGAGTGGTYSAGVTVQATNASSFGSGGGGGAYDLQAGGDGYAGLVIVRYAV
jgi:hypothetical protein